MDPPLLPARSRKQEADQPPHTQQPNSQPSVKLRRPPNHTWLKRRGADSCTRADGNRSSNSVSRSSELKPHNPIAITGASDSEVEKGSEYLIPPWPRRLHLANAAGKTNPNPKGTYSTPPDRDPHVPLTSEAQKGHRRRRRTAVSPVGGQGTRFPPLSTVATGDFAREPERWELGMEKEVSRV